MPYHQTFLWGSSQNKLREEELWLESFCLIGLFLAALILFLVNLGGLPLLDSDEAIIAQVAKEIWQAPQEAWGWCFPTLFREPYLNHPPLVHALIALTYAVAGIHEFTTRFPGAILASISVLLLYSIGREIFVARIPALFSALVYLTLLPVVHQGRLAMLDGPLLCFELLTIWGILRSRRDLRWAVVAGTGLSTLYLTNSIMGLLLTVVVLFFLWWDTPRLISSSYLWVGIFLGIVPALMWYIVQWYHYRSVFLEGIWQSLEQIGLATAEPQQAFQDYLFELLRYPLPWLIFAIYGLKSAWSRQHWGWAKLILVWSGVYLVAASLMTRDFSWYMISFYPVIALATGMQLNEILHSPRNNVYPRFWAIGFGLMTGLTLGISFYLGWQKNIDLSLVLIFISLILTFGVTTILIAKQDRQFISLLFWGMYVSLFLLINSSHWIWELDRTYPVKPIATLIRNNVPDQEIIYTSDSASRASLNFYSEHLVIPASRKTLEKHWHESANPFLLIDSLTLEELDFKTLQIINNPKTDPHSWLLITKTQNKLPNTLRE